MPKRIGLGLLAIASLCFADDILRPTDQSILKSGPISIIVRGSSLKLDGKPLAATQPAAGVSSATATPSAGAHELCAGDQCVKFFIGAASAPSGWKEFKVHPPAATCDACHAVNNGAWEIKGGVVGDNCFKCHDAKPFPKIHQHNTEVLADCQLCHNPHGSTARFHLKMAKETACKQCHG